MVRASSEAMRAGPKYKDLKQAEILAVFAQCNQDILHMEPELEICSGHVQPPNKASQRLTLARYNIVPPSLTSRNRA